MKKILLTILIVVIALGVFITHSKTRAELVAIPIMERCWNTDSMKVVSLFTRVNFRQGINWLVKAKYTENGSTVAFDNPQYGNVPEILVNVFNGEVVWKHFEEIGDPSGGCE